MSYNKILKIKKPQNYVQYLQVIAPGQKTKYRILGMAYFAQFFLAFMFLIPKGTPKREEKLILPRLGKDLAHCGLIVPSP